MTKRILFSLFTGILFGILLTVTPEAKAQDGAMLRLLSGAHP